MLETIKGMTIRKDVLQKRMRLADPEFFNKQIEKHRSTIVVMSHCGNWEWVCLAAQISIEQHAQCVYKTLSNPNWDAWFFQLRSRFGTAPFSMEKTMRVMNSNSHIVTATAFIGDQNPSSGKNVYWTNFLHQETCFMQGSEKIARKLDHDVVYMRIEKEKRGFYVCHIDVLTTDPKATKEGEITEMIVRATEKDIQQQPENWLWSHRRWKHQKES
jgi:KDO2-lipid IV(A) lauroyltransferase